MATNYLLEFIQNHPDDWEEKLSSDPYNLKISRDGPYVMFKYNQLSSDFSNPIVREIEFDINDLIWDDFNLPLEEELDTVDYLTLTELKAELAIHIHELNKLGYGCL